MTNLFLLISYLLALSFAEPVRARRKLQDFWGTTQEPPEYCPMDRMVREVDECTDASATDNCACYEAIEYAIENGFNEMGYGCITPSGATFKQELSYCIYGVYEVVAPCFEEGPYVVDHPTLPFQVCAMSPDTIDDGYGYCYTNDDRWYIGDSCREYDNYDNLCPYDPPQVGKRCWDTEEGCYYGDWVCCCDDCRQMQYVSCSGEGGWISTMDASCSNDCAPVIHDSCNEDLIVSISWHYSEEVQQSCLEMPYGCLCLTTIMDAIHHGLEDLDPGCYTRSGLTFEEEALLCDGDGEVCIDHLRYYAHRCADGTLFNSNIGSVAACSAKASELGMASFNYRESNGKCIVPNNNDNCMEDTLISQNNNWDIYQIYCEIPKCPIEVPWTTEPCVDESLDCYYGEIVCCCDACRPTMVKSCSINFDWISYMDESCDDECTPITYDMCNIYLIEAIGQMYDSPIPEECTDLGQPDDLGGGSLTGCECYRTIADAVDHGLDFDMSCMMRTGKTFEEEVQSCPPAGECTDGEEDNSNPCSPRHCAQGMWMTLMIDCQEWMTGDVCPGGWIPAEEGECCSTCPFPTIPQPCPEEATCGVYEDGSEDAMFGCSCAAGGLECVPHEGAIPDNTGLMFGSCKGCPFTPPRVGDYCSDPNLDCMYGDYKCCCGICEQTQLVSCSSDFSWISMIDISCSMPNCEAILYDACDIQVIQSIGNMYDSPVPESCSASIVGCECYEKIADAVASGLEFDMSCMMPSHVTFEREAEICANTQCITFMSGMQSRCDGTALFNDNLSSLTDCYNKASQLGKSIFSYRDDNGKCYITDNCANPASNNNWNTYEIICDVAECPADPPQVGDPCVDTDLSCEYGNWVCCCDECRQMQLVSCSSDNTWISFMSSDCDNGCTPSYHDACDLGFIRDAGMYYSSPVPESCIDLTCPCYETLADAVAKGLPGLDLSCMMPTGNSFSDESNYCSQMPDDPSCPYGIWDIGDSRTPFGVCCDAACGQCGGDDCNGLPGGGDKCCIGRIRNNGRYCEDSYDTGCIVPSPGGNSDISVVSLKFDTDFDSTCANNKDLFLTACTAFLGDPRAWCFECTEGSTVVTVAGYDTVLNEKTYDVVNRGQIELPGYSVMSLVGPVDTPPEVYQDMNDQYGSVNEITPDDPEYTYELLFRQTYPYLYEQGEISKNAYDPDNDNYAILDQMENYRQDDGKFYFRLTWPGDTVVFEWAQTSNPVTEAIAGYEPIVVPYTAGGWGGLENGQIGRDTAPAALIDGSVGVDSYYYAVGLIEDIFHGGIPSYGKTNGDKTYPQQQVELYARIGATDICCMAMTATCLACQASMTVEEYCNLNPDTDGCSSFSFTLRGVRGDERVIITGCDVSEDEITLTTTDVEYTCSNSDITIEFLNDDTNADVVFTTDISTEIINPPYSAMWSCNTPNEDPVRCEMIRNGEFNWGGTYEITFLPDTETTEDPSCNGCRIRRSWNVMSEAARTQYLETIIAVTDGSHPALETRYNDMVQMHQAQFNNGIHWAEQFLPWHRWFILKFEDLLREVEPCITVPYWAWELDSGRADLHTNNYVLWGNADYELGSVTDPEGCVADGKFSQAQGFTLSDGSSCLQRGQSGTFDNLVDIQTNVWSKDSSDWEGFTNSLEGAHDGVHCVIDGTMCTGSSAEDPMFFLHHVNIDRMWSIWQDKGADYKFAQQFESNYNDPMIGVDNGETPAHFADLQNQYNGVCAIYQDLSAAPDDPDAAGNANAYHDVLTLLDEMPDDADFWKDVPHSKELTLDKAEEFIENILVAGGMSQEDAEQAAQDTLDRLGRTGYVENRVVNDVKNVAVTTMEDVLIATLGTSTANLRETLVNKGYTDEVDVLDFEAVTLERKYTHRDVCDPNPCAYGATCSTGYDGSAVCSCSAGYEGRSCSKDVCSPNPCANGSCYTGISGTAACECDSGYMGDRCEDEYCEYTDSTVCQGCRCAPDSDHDYVEEQLGYRGCLEKALALGVRYFSLSTNNKCRVPTNDPEGQCVDNIEGYKGDWNTYEVEPLPCPTTTEGTGCEEAPIVHCNECRCLSTYSDIVYNGITLQACFNWALFYGIPYFSYSNQQECRIPGEDPEDNCVTNVENYNGDWDTYFIDMCTTTPEPSECEGSYDLECDECRCSTTDDDIIVQPSTVEDCHDLARDNGRRYFSFSSANKCRIPMGDEDEDCVTNVENYKGDWDLYRLTMCTTAIPTTCDSEMHLLCDECRCASDYGDIVASQSTVQDCYQLALDNGKTYFSFSETNGNKCRVPGGDEQTACVTEVQLYKGDWDLWQIVDCGTPPPTECDNTYEVLCTECRCLAQNSDVIEQPSTVQQCFELADSLEATYFSLSTQAKCRVPTSRESQHCVDNVEQYKGDWTTYEIIDCEGPTTTGEPCETTPTPVCTDCKCSSHADDYEAGYQTYESCLASATAAGAEFMWFNSDSGRCRYPGGDPDEQCVTNIEYNKDHWITYSLTTCVTEEPCQSTSEALCSDCKCTKSAYIDDYKDNSMTAQQCHDWAMSLGIYYYWYKADETKCRIPATDSYDQCVTNQDPYGNNWIVYQIIPCGQMDTCPGDTSGLSGGSSCSQYLAGLQCGTGKECCCGECFDEKTLTCDGNIWQAVNNDHCANPSCSCSDVWPWKFECKNIVQHEDCFGYYDYCAKSCGCDFDLAQARADAGIDDNAVESATCVTGNGFQDSRGFNCDVYEGAYWCAKDGNDVVEGDGWCKRWPFSDYQHVDEAQCRVVPGRNRMYTFGHYVNDAGLDARVCCCDTDKADEYQYDLGWGDNGGTCNDRTFHDGVAWHDKNGWTCRVYAFGDLCTVYGTKGSGWNDDWGTIAQNAFGDTTLGGDMDATDACCACGGGDTDPGYDSILPHLVNKIGDRLNKGYNERNFNRMAKHTRAVLDHNSKRGSNYNPSHISLIQSMNDIANGYKSEARWNEMENLWDNKSF